MGTNKSDAELILDPRGACAMDINAEAVQKMTITSNEVDKEEFNGFIMEMDKILDPQAGVGASSGR